MSVAVAHQVSPTGDAVLEAALGQAAQQGTDLVVIHVVDTVDADVEAASRAGVSDAIDRALAARASPAVPWRLELVAGGHDIGDVTAAILGAVTSSGADLLVIGVRRRSPLGKAFLGSVSQLVILDAEVPVLAVKR